MKLRHLIILLVLSIVLFSALETQREGLMHSGASPYNTRWDGTSNFIKLLSYFSRVEIVNSWISLDLENYINNYSCRIIFIISPEQSFSQSEINTITNLVKNNSFNLIILDEGPYTNDIIKALGLPIFIDAFKYIDVFGRRKGVVGVVPGFIELDIEYYTLFSYVSPISFSNISSCRRIAYTVEGDTVGVLCKIQGSLVLVVGDGSIAINAVVPLPPTKNVYTDIVEGMVNFVCKGKNIKILSLVDASKYRFRVLTFNELVEEGYNTVEAFMLTFNPFRYLYPYLYDKELYIISGFSVATTIFFAIAIVRTSRRIRLEVAEENRREIFTIFPGYSRIALEILVGLCKSHKQCIKEVPCILRKVNDRCIKQVSRYMSKDRDFRRKVLEKILLS